MHLSRRKVILSTGSVLLAASSSTACSEHPKPAPPARTGQPPSVVRVASVPTAVEGNLLPTLVSAFENEHPHRIALTSTEDPYGSARAGLVDLAISHYGHRDAESFVLDGFGEWPRTLFSNQMALLGPSEDPAKIRGVQDAGEAFRRIAETRSLFVVNHIEGVRYLVEILWNAAGRPSRTGWLLDEGHRKDAAMEYASARGAYSLWGLTPFLRLKQQAPLNLEPFAASDPLFQRMLVSIIVKRTKVASANQEGALAFQTFLLSPVTQARIREIRYPGATSIPWVPGGRHNRTAMLPLG